jgi:hypothetical protein
MSEIVLLAGAFGDGATGPAAWPITTEIGERADQWERSTARGECHG